MLYIFGVTFERAKVIKSAGFLPKGCLWLGREPEVLNFLHVQRVQDGWPFVNSNLRCISKFQQ